MNEPVEMEIAEYIRRLGAISIDRKIRLARFRFSASLEDVCRIVMERVPEEELPKNYQNLVKKTVNRKDAETSSEDAHRIAREMNLWKQPHFKSVYNKIYMRNRAIHGQCDVLALAVHEYLHGETVKAKKTNRRVEYLKVEELLLLISEHPEAYVQIGRKLATEVRYDEEKGKVTIL